MLKWWQSADKLEAYRWLFLMSLLFGLDFSVHRTNLVILPALLFWVLLRHPKTLITLKSWLYGLGGFFLGLVVHLLIIPMALRNPLMNATDPSSLSGFWDYVALKQQGGGFLFNLFPRKAAFWGVQVTDFTDAFNSNFFNTQGTFGFLGILPVVLGLVGIVMLWRKNPRLGAAYTLLFLVTAAVTILYFNIPANFFRSLDRHYFPCLVMAAVWVAYGSATVLHAVWNLRGKLRVVIGILAALLLVLTPFQQIYSNYGNIDGSKQYFTEDYAYNMLATLPENAILFTSGDNDSFPLWYLQIGEGIRTDVTVMNMPLMNTHWYLKQTLEFEPDFPLGLSIDDIAQLNIQPWQDTTIAIPVVGDAASHHLTPESVIPDTMYFDVSPTIADNYLMIQDWVLINIIKENQWQRPLYFSYPPRWLNSYMQPEGVTSRLVPVSVDMMDLTFLKTNLLEKYKYRGYADSLVPLESSSRNIGLNYYQSFLMLAMSEQRAGDVSACEETIKTLLQYLPLERIEPSERMQMMIEQVCQQSDNEDES
jgi:hypothetical protein